MLFRPRIRPNNVDQVPKLLSQYKGREHSLYTSLHFKYGTMPGPLLERDEKCSARANPPQGCDAAAPPAADGTSALIGGQWRPRWLPKSSVPGFELLSNRDALINADTGEDDTDADLRAPQRVCDACHAALQSRS